MESEPCNVSGTKASGWFGRPGDEVGRVKASWVEDMVALWLRVSFEDDENKLVNQLIS